MEKIDDQLNKANAVAFIKAFTLSISQHFKNLEQLFNIDEKTSHEIHSLASLGRIGSAMPFMLKAYDFDLLLEDKKKLSGLLESILLRHRLVGTRADLNARLNNVFQKFTDKNNKIQPIIDHIDYLKTTEQGGWNYWNNTNLRKSLDNKPSHALAKFLLWKYENILQSKGKQGYALTRYDSIEQPELEHIAPRTKNNEIIANGYGEYDEDFRNKYLDCLGNYLLISKSHNCSIGNRPFPEKLASYQHLAQQREIHDFTEKTWDKVSISKRHERIIELLMSKI